MIVINTIRSEPFGNRATMKSTGRIPKKYEQVVLLNHKLKRGWVGMTSGSGIRNPDGSILYTVSHLKEKDYKTLLEERDNEK